MEIIQWKTTAFRRHLQFIQGFTNPGLALMLSVASWFLLSIIPVAAKNVEIHDGKVMELACAFRIVLASIHA